MSSLLIRDAALLTMDGNPPIRRGWVLVEGERIAAVGEGAPLAAGPAVERTIDAAGMGVMPGLVNGHTHFSQVLMRGLADGRPLVRWLKEVIWPLQAAMTPEDVYLASKLALLENLRGGVTSVVQHHKITASSAHVEAAARAAEEVGLRMLLARTWTDTGAGAESPGEILEEMSRLHERWHGAAGGRITIAFGPSVPWRCSDDTMRGAVALAREWGVPTHIHVAETQAEVEMLRERTGLRHIEWLASLGVLGPDFQLVHAVWLSDAEMDLIAGSGATVVHCPVSNMYLASGAAPVPRLLAAGVPVALGTDGAASNNSQDLFETMKTTALLAKLTAADPNAVLPLEVLRMATAGGARLFGRDDLGRIAPGMRADLALVRLDTPRSTPAHRADSALVYTACAADVDTVIVDGQVLLDRGRIPHLDEVALLRECEAAAYHLLARAGLS